MLQREKVKEACTAAAWLFGPAAQRDRADRFDEKPIPDGMFTCDVVGDDPRYTTGLRRTSGHQ